MPESHIVVFVWPQQGIFPDQSIGQVDVLEAGAQCMLDQQVLPILGHFGSDCLQKDARDVDIVVSINRQKLRNEVALFVNAT